LSCVIVFQATHWTELIDVLRVAAPVLGVAAAVSAVILVVATKPPPRMRLAVAESRRTLVIAAAGIPIGALCGFAILYWTI